MVFKEVFDYHYFMTFNDWFDGQEDFDMLRIFMEAINEQYLYCAVPDFDNCPDLKIDMSLGYANFKSQYLMQDHPEHPNHNEGTEAEISKMMHDFDKSVPRPNGSSLFFYPENYKAKNDDISSYDPSVEEVVEQCLSYKMIQL